MISTIESKQQQLQNGYFQSGTGSKQILIVGSCRTLAYLSYLIRWNDGEGRNEFIIRRIDPCDWAVSNIDVASFENDERILSVIKSADIFIHEHLVNYGMFNTDLAVRKNIYQFGITPEFDISVPNFNDVMVLRNDYTDYGVPVPHNYIEIGESEVEKFCQLCKLTSFPEMGDYFRDQWRNKRFFWRPNHVSAVFTIYIFMAMNDKFLHLPLTDDFWAGAGQEDLFKYPHTQVTQQDRDAYRLTWN
jgi:hypothetical protein